MDVEDGGSIIDRFFPRKTPNLSTKWILLILGFFCLQIGACQPLIIDPLDGMMDEGKIVNEIKGSDDFPIMEAQENIIKAWLEGPHANTYNLEKGPNTYCAQCHSPSNWDPGATIDPPPNCVSCKFPFEDTPRTAAGNPLVDEDDWHGIRCENCHRKTPDRLAGEIAWLDVRTGYYETIESPTELCEQCHRNTETLRHQRLLGDESHRHFDCTTCHDPHTTQADCLTSGCHHGIEETHDDVHKIVACAACHDASGMEIGYDSEKEQWITFRTTELLGRISKQPYLSHNLQKAVDCTRCHYEDNPFGLNVHERQ